MYDIEKNFNEAVNLLQDGYFENFTVKFIEVYSNLPCFCFINKQHKELWLSIDKNIEQFSTKKYDDFNYSLIKGFINLFLNEREIAKRYLDEALRINPNSSICYNLKSQFISFDKSEINNALFAVAIDNNSINNFNLGIALERFDDDESSLSKAIYFYDKSKSFGGDSKCANNNIANCIESINKLNHKNTFKYDYIKSNTEVCLKSEKLHWSNYYLWHIAINNDIEEAFKISKAAYNNDPNCINWIYAYGISSACIGNYKDASEYLMLFLNKLKILENAYLNFNDSFNSEIITQIFQFICKEEAFNKEEKITFEKRFNLFLEKSKSNSFDDFIQEIENKFHINKYNVINHLEILGLIILPVIDSVNFISMKHRCQFEASYNQKDIHKIDIILKYKQFLYNIDFATKIYFKSLNKDKTSTALYLNYNYSYDCVEEIEE